MNSLTRSAILGGLGFGLASLLVFATVAFGERWMYTHLGLWGAYLTWTALFIGLGGGVLLPLVSAPWRGGRFVGLFGLAFFLYAVGWVAAYFLARGSRLGEWLGSLLGSLAMGQAFVVGFKVRKAPLRLAAVLFLANSVGYFVGSALNDMYARPTGMLLWGGVYGICLGAGLGAVLFLTPKQAAAL
jgi:hypothetical protein